MGVCSFSEGTCWVILKMTVVLFEFIYLFYFAVEKMVQIGKEVLEKQNADLNDVRYVGLEQTCNAVFVWCSVLI